MSVSQSVRWSVSPNFEHLLTQCLADTVMKCSPFPHVFKILENKTRNLISMMASIKEEIGHVMGTIYRDQDSFVKN